jgi:hypothetical protein
MAEDKLNFDKVHGTFTSAFVPYVSVTKVSGGDFLALVYQCKFNVDWDGAPKAYGWDNPATLNNLKQPCRQKNLSSIETGPTDPHRPPKGLRNATSPTKDINKNPIGFGLGSQDFDWVGVVSATKSEAGNRLVIDDRPVLEARHGKFPVVQNSGDTAGYYVSQSGSFAQSGSKYEQSSYWNASSIRYAVWPSVLHSQGLTLGDFGLVIRNQTGNASGFFFADTGSYNILGECSGHLVETVSGSARNNNDTVSFIVFPGSGGSATPASEGNIEGVVQTQMGYLNLPNSEELIIFLALGADPDRWKNGYDTSRINRVVYDNIRRGLVANGFRSTRKPITEAMLAAPIG